MKLAKGRLAVGPPTSTEERASDLYKTIQFELNKSINAANTYDWGLIVFFWTSILSSSAAGIIGFIHAVPREIVGVLAAVGASAAVIPRNSRFQLHATLRWRRADLLRELCNRYKYEMHLPLRDEDVTCLSRALTEINYRMAAATRAGLGQELPLRVHDEREVKVPVEEVS